MTDCRIEVETNAYYRERERQEQLAEANAESLAEAAQETLDKINELAERMMEGEIFKARDMTFSLDASDYISDNEYCEVEKVFAMKTPTVSQTFNAANQLREIMYNRCRSEASIYLNINIETLEDVISEHKRDHK